MAVRNVSVLALYNDRMEVLLQHRSKDAERLPEYWGFFGGDIEEGETPAQALARELLEEIEYAVGAPQFVCAQKFAYGGDEHMKYAFIEKYDPGKKLIQHEGQGMGWWKFEDMKDLLIADHDQAILLKIREFLAT